MAQEQGKMAQPPSLYCFMTRKVLAFAEKERAAQEQDKQSKICDVYHSATRYLMGTEDASSIILPKSQIWHFEKNRLIVAIEMLRLQGLVYDASQYEGFTDTHLRDLAGNAPLSMITLTPVRAQGI